MKFFDPKTPDERRTLTFDFTDDLPSGVTVDSVAAISVTAFRGIDVSPSSILYGSPDLSGAQVFQSVQGGLSDVDYLVIARANWSDGQIAELMAVLPVKVAI